MLSPAILFPYTTTASSTTATFPVSFSGTDSSSSSSSSSSSFSSIATHCLLTPSRSRTLTLPSSAITVRSRKTKALLVRASSSSMIEKETPESQRPHTFLRESDNEPLSVVDSNSTASSSSVRARFEKMIREAQDRVCAAIEEVDGGGKFKEDVWSRPGGGGGISRVLQDGAIWEKAGVNVSVVYGVMPPEAYRAAKPVNADANSSSSVEKPGPVPFFAAGISSVISPFIDELSFNSHTNADT